MAVAAVPVGGAIPPPLLPASAALGWAAAVLLGLGPFIGYVASRSVGVPGDPGDVGNWGYWVGTVSLFVEGSLVVLSPTVLVAIWQSPGRSVPSRPAAVAEPARTPPARTRRQR